jgi:hypothetical protein
MTQEFRSVVGGLTNFPTTPAVKTITMGFKNAIPYTPQGLSGEANGGFLTFQFSGKVVRVSAYITGGFDGVDAQTIGPYGTFQSWPFIAIAGSTVRLEQIPETFEAPTTDGPQQPYSGWLIVDYLDVGGNDVDLTINPFDYIEEGLHP